MSYSLPSKLINQLEYVAENSPYYKKVLSEKGIEISRGMTIDDFSRIPAKRSSELRGELRDDPKKLYCKHVIGPFFDYCPLPTVTPVLLIRMTSADLENLSRVVRSIFEFFNIKHGRVLVDQLGFCNRSLFFNICQPATVLPTSFYISDVFKLKVVENFGLPAPPSASRGVFIIKTFRPKFFIIDRELVPFYEKLFIEQKVALGDFVEFITVVSELSANIKPLLGKEKREFIEKHKVKTLKNILQAVEVLFLAPECKDEAFHVFEDYYFVEVIDPKTHKSLPLGKEGKLTITNLFTEGSPIIRYLTPIDGVLSREDCPLGRDALHIRIVR